MNRRVLLVVAIVAALVVGFVVLRPQDDDKPSATTAAPTATATTPSSGTATPTAPARPPKPKVPTIRVEGLKPVGGVRKIKVDKGDQLRFRVTSDAVENVHLHGYDIEKPVAPGKAASFSLKANLEGIFELELENSAVPIGEVTVNP
jgi:hypothetical protein